MKLVILDRDGVINYDSADYIKHPDEWLPIPGSLEAIARLNRAGFRVVIATNQSGIQRNLFSMADLNAMHSKMLKMLGQLGGRIDAIFYCPHHEGAACRCRKPQPGMLEEISARFELSLRHLACIGDSLRDLQAAAAVRGKPILVLTGKGQKTQETGQLPQGTLIFPDLAATADYLIAERSQS